MEMTVMTWYSSVWRTRAESSRIGTRLDGDRHIHGNKKEEMPGRLFLLFCLGEIPHIINDPLDHLLF